MEFISLLVIFFAIIVYFLLSILFISPEWATALFTLILAVITAYYAYSTKKILEINKQHLEVYADEIKREKVREISIDLLKPLKNRVIEDNNKLKNNGYFSLKNGFNNLYVSINIDQQLLRFFEGRMDYILLDNRYSEQIFQKYIHTIEKCVSDHDNESGQFFNLFNSGLKMIRTEKLDTLIKRYSQKEYGYYNPNIEYDYDIFINSLLKGELASLPISHLNHAPEFWKIYFEDVKQEIQTDEEIKILLKSIESKKSLLITLEQKIKNDINNCLNEWANKYHFPGRAIR